MTIKLKGPKTVFSQADVAASTKSALIDCQNQTLVGFSVAVTDASSAEFTFTIEVAIGDPLVAANWVATTATTDITADGVIILSKDDVAERYARVSITRTAGTASLEIIAVSKG